VVEGIINAFTANGGPIFTLKASLDLILDYPLASMAWVIGGPVTAYNNIYPNLGASGIGS
jgi:nucleoside permease NupC